MPIDSLREVMGLSYHEGKYKLAANGRYLNADEVVAKIEEEASKRPSPKEFGLVVIISKSELEAYQKLRYNLLGQIVP